jgi:hypothetical protein
MLIIDNPEYREVYTKALKVWGAEKQKMQAVGEIGEFLAELGRERQGRSTPEQTIDEIADVIIMMTQMAMIYGEQAVKDRIAIKVEKVKTKLKDK